MYSSEAVGGSSGSFTAGLAPASAGTEATVIYTVRLGSYISTGAGLHTIYTGPATGTTIVRDIEVLNASGVALNTAVVIPGVGSIWANGALGPGAFEQWQGRQVVEAGEILQVFASGANVEFMVTGYVLTP